MAVSNSLCVAVPRVVNVVARTNSHMCAVICKKSNAICLQKASVVLGLCFLTSWNLVGHSFPPQPPQIKSLQNMRDIQTSTLSILQIVDKHQWDKWFLSSEIFTLLEPVSLTPTEADEKFLKAFVISSPLHYPIFTLLKPVHVWYEMILI